MYPKPRPKLTYEKVSTEDWTTGIIEEVQHVEDRVTGYKDKDGEDEVKDQVRFKFKLDGYKFPHYSGWMSFGYGEKFTLFIQYVSNLVEDAVPEMRFNLGALKGLPVKVMWKNNGDFQKVETIRPLKAKVKKDSQPPLSEAVEPPGEPEEGELVEAEPF